LKVGGDKGGGGMVVVGTGDKGVRGIVHRDFVLGWVKIRLLEGL
jgi:hypothetical protein